MQAVYVRVVMLISLLVCASGQNRFAPCDVRKLCVSRALCLNGVIRTNGADIIMPRAGNFVSCTWLQTCCAIPTAQQPQEKCGWRNPFAAGERLLQNDEVAHMDFGEFPWLVALYDESDNLLVQNNIRRPVCAGSLIAPDVVLTAYHCVGSRRVDSLMVHAGAFDISAAINVSPPVLVGVNEIILHERHHRGALHNDIALLMLQQPLKWSDTIRPICLPNARTLFDSQNCYVTGWGKDKYGSTGRYQTTPKKIKVPLVAHQDCEERFRETLLGPFFELDHSFLCAGGQRAKDACEGDGGAPLMCPDLQQSGHYHLVGIVSWGLECGAENVPGAYVNVSHARAWIDGKIENRTNTQHFTLSN